jgi:NAD(P)-dependent dehydrogenase (short-subunit alcohol dehydrogenase family)
MTDQRIAIIVGAGLGLSASLARKFSLVGMKVALAARNIHKLTPLITEISGLAYTCDTSDPGSVQALFSRVKEELGVPELVVFNASKRVRGDIDKIDPVEVKNALLTSCYGGFLVGQEASKLMLSVGNGTIIFTGASAGVKGFPRSATFAMGKFGLRGLAQSMSRELHPRNIHVVHVVIDGGIQTIEKIIGKKESKDGWLSPDSIAETYYQLHIQHRSAWSSEIEVRPWVEKF